MFTRNTLVRVFAILLALLISTTASAQSINSFTIGQVSWLDSTGSPISGGTDSRWGDLTLNVTPDPSQSLYVNMEAKQTGSSGTPAWMVQNLPIFPASIGGDTNQSVALDLADVIPGFTPGTALGNLDVTLSLDTVPQPTEPVLGATFANVTPQGLTRQAQEPKLDLANPQAYIGTPAGHKAGGANAAAPVNVIQHRNVPSVQEGNAQCLAGSFARSIKWLDNQYGLPNLPANTSAQSIFGTLTGPTYKVSSPNTSYSDDVAAKAKYLQTLDPNAQTKVFDITGALNPAPAGTTRTTPTANFGLIDYLYQELRTEDIELHYDTHIVTVTGIYRQGGKTFVRYRDDEFQGNNARGDAAEKDAEITSDANGYYFNRNDGRAGGMIKIAISESVPEPHALVLAAGALLVGRRRRRSAFHRVNDERV